MRGYRTKPMILFASLNLREMKDPSIASRHLTILLLCVSSPSSTPLFFWMGPVKGVGQESIRLVGSPERFPATLRSSWLAPFQPLSFPASFPSDIRGHFPQSHGPNDAGIPPYQDFPPSCDQSITTVLSVLSSEGRPHKKRISWCVCAQCRFPPLFNTQCLGKPLIDA